MGGRPSELAADRPVPTPLGLLIGFIIGLGGLGVVALVLWAVVCRGLGYGVVAVDDFRYSPGEHP